MDDNKLTKIDGYPVKHITEKNIVYDTDVYVCDPCLNVVRKNNKVIHRFTDVNYAFGTCHLINGKRLAIIFVSNNKMTYLIDDDKSTTIREFPVNNIKFINQISIQPIFD